MEPKTAGCVSGQSRPARQIESLTSANLLPADSLVLTLDGALPFAFLGRGDRVITRDSGMAVLTGTCRRTLTRDAVSIAAGSLGNARPDRSIMLPASTRMLIRDWRAQALFGTSCALVPAARLVDGEFVKAMGPRTLDLVELIFDAPHIIYADGLEVASSVRAPA